MTPRNPCKPWECDLETTGKARRLAFFDALLRVGGHFTCAFAIGAMMESPWNSIFFMVHIPEGEEARFEELSGCKLLKLREVHVN